MKDFRELKVWQKAHRFVLSLYQVAKSFPKEELVGLTSQLRRASVSMTSNIAEGCGRSGDPELARFLQIAMGSSSEVEYQILLTHDLGLLQKEKYHELNSNIVEIKRMLSSLIQTVRGGN